ncbi:DNJC2 protein, partial [Polypterus senegalus]
ILYKCISHIGIKMFSLFPGSVQFQVEPVGRWFEAYLKRRTRNVSASFQELEDEKELSEESEDEELQLEEFPMLKTLDPKDWKGNNFSVSFRFLACEILSDPVKRRAFDSVDPTFDNAVPSKSEGKENFFDVFAPVFERNSRWTSKKHVPKLGNMSSSFEDVDAFYSFWYNFDSWREFSYLDEEEKEKAECCDPRIKKFKDDEKARKEAEKKAKADAKRKEQEERERIKQAELEAERLRKEKEEEEAKQVALQAKKEKEVQKKAIKKERQKLRTICKNWSYFSENESESVKMMEEVEKLCDRLELTSLQTLNEVLASSTKEESKAAVEKQIQDVNAQLQKEKEEAEAKARQLSKSSEQMNAGAGIGGKGWNEDDLQLLIKAVNLFPAGTNARWEVIANYMNLHSTSGIKRNAKDVINKAKNLQKLDPHQKDEINKKAFEKFKKEHNAVPQNVDNAVPSERFDAASADAAPWTTEEQKLLEQALKTFPVNTPERWEKIAEAVPSRSKKDCMKRYKELVEMVKAKKAAQEQVTAKSKK